MKKIDKKPKLLITGGTGVLGTALVEELSCFYDCIPLGKSSVSNNRNRADLTIKSESYNFLNSICPDIIIHAAALTNVDECEKNTKKAFELNVQATSYIVDWVKEQDKKIKFVYISTDSVYSNCEYGCSENQVYPVNSYGITKLWAENLVKKVKNSLILRTNFYTAFGKRGVIEWLVNSINNNETLTLFTDIKFNPLYLNHLVVIIERCLSMDVDGLFNIGANNKGISKSDFLKLIINRFSLNKVKYVYGVSSDSEFMTATRPANMTMLTRKFELETGIELPSIADGVDQMYKDYIER